MRFPVHRPTVKLLKDLKGLEIGEAAHNPYGVDAQNVAPLKDFKRHAKAQIQMCGKAAKIDIEGYAHSIPVPADSVDFVLASHLIGHISDLEPAFAEWQRVIRPEGYVVIVVPLPGVLSAKPKHGLTTLGDVQARVGTDNTIDKHYWIFTPENLKAIIAHFQPGWRLVGFESPDSKVGNGTWAAYRTARTAPVQPTRSVEHKPLARPVTIIIPTLDEKRGQETAKRALAAAGCVAKVIVVSGPARGFTKTVNEGLEQTTDEDVCLLNDDITSFQANWLYDMSQGLHSSPEYGVIGPSGKSGTAPANRGRPGMKGFEPARQVSYWCVLLRRELIDAIGHLDERYIHYCSDNDYNDRAHKTGWKVVWMRSVYIGHEYHGSGRQQAWARADRKVYKGPKK